MEASRRPVQVAAATAALIAVLATLVAALTTTTSTATAATRPRPVTPFFNNQIAVQTSIGGITLGTTAARAGRHFPRGSCGRSGCSYESARDGYSVYFNLSHNAHHAHPYVGRVTMVARRADGPLRRLRTGSGVGIGSTRSALKGAYPQLRGTYNHFYLERHGRRTYFDLRGSRIYSIAVALS